ncbi:MAG: SDR family NAD(P)-dependent oxidoreductase [Anaerolineae bacterium]|nr:SDR family NAD(P)-dependent oxidoreductase [Anaerolineae bacterium]
MRYLVTGATGFIGGKLARELLRRGHQVVTVARNPDKAADLAALGVEIHKGDITDKDSLRAPMTGVDGLFHVAAWYKVGARNVHMAYDINVNGTRNVLEVMRELGIPKGVYTSTLAVYGDTHGAIADESTPMPSSFDVEYDRTKALAHFEVALPMMREGLPLVIVQPGVVYGPDDTSLLRQTFLM